MNSASTRFATFEILRIVVPGAYGMFLVMTYTVGFDVSMGRFQTWEYGLPFFFVGSVIAGLSFYAKETPKKRKAFLTNQPSLFILQRSREIASANPLTEDEARRLYFYLLNHHMPVTVHDKIFFFGMIYHIMVYVRRISFWFGLLGIFSIIGQIALIQHTTVPAVAVVFTTWCLYGIAVRHNKADRKMQENYQDQIFWLEMNIGIVDTLVLQRTTRP